jgi:serine/threonine protein kinase/WD40 repeat protein
MEMGVGVEPELLDFTDLFFEDSLEGKARPLADYLARFPRAEAAVAREWLRLMGVEEGAEIHPPDSEDHGEDRVGHYKLIKELGRGGQGEVWLAQDTRIARQVALKFMPQGFGLISEDKKGRFRREAEAIARLEHPGLCRIYDADVDADSPWIAMRLVEGEALSARIHRAKEEEEDSRSKEILPVKPVSKPELHRLLRFFERSARALHAAHEAGVIHRDIKPGNLMVTPEGEPVLLDFGMARGDDLGLQELTASGDIFGTPSYMAPEQVRGASDEIDVRADVWALGVTLHEALTLERPFVGQGTADILNSVISSNPSKPSEQNSVVTDELDVIVATALERDLDRRYPTAFELAEELRRICEYEPIRARPAGPLLKLARWARRHPALAASVTISFLSLSAGLITTTWLRAKEQVALDHALGRHLAERSGTLLDSDPNTSLGLAIDAMELSAHEFTRSTLLKAMTTHRLSARFSCYPARQFTDLDISPDGRLLLMAVKGHTGRVFDIGQDETLFDLEAHDSDLIRARFVKGGLEIVTVSEDGHIVRWTNAGQLLTEQRIEEELHGVVISEDGEIVVGITEDGEAIACAFGQEDPIRLSRWDGSESTPLQEIVLGNSDAVLVARDEGGLVHIWSTMDYEPHELIECEEPAVDIAFHPGSSGLAVLLADGALELWDVETNDHVASGRHGEGAKGLRFSNSGEYLASFGGGAGLGGGGSIHIWKAESLDLVSSIQGGKPFMDVVFDPAGDRIAACDGGHEIGLFDVHDAERLGRLVNVRRHTGLRWSQDGVWLASLSRSNIAPVWFMGQRESIPSVRSRLGTPSELLSFGGSTLVLHEEGALADWELSTGELSLIDSGAIGPVRGMNEASEPGRILVWGEGGVGVWGESSSELSWILETDSTVIDAHGDEEAGVLLDAAGAAFVWAANGALRSLGPAECVGMTSRGGWIAVGGKEGLVELHSISAHAVSRTLTVESKSIPPKSIEVNELTFSPDGSQLAVHSSDRYVRAFDLVTGQEIMSHRWALLKELEYSPDGQHLLLMTGKNPTARVVDSVRDESQDVVPFRSSKQFHDAKVVVADFGPDSSFVLTGSEDGVLQVWSSADGQAFLFHDHMGDAITAVSFRGGGEDLSVLAASKGGHLWGLPVYPMKRVREYGPQPLLPHVADRESKLAAPFSYLPGHRISRVPDEG